MSLCGCLYLYRILRWFARHRTARRPYLLPFSYHTTVLHYPILSYPILSYPILSYTILYYTILYYTILYYTINRLHYTTLQLHYTTLLLHYTTLCDTTSDLCACLHFLDSFTTTRPPFLLLTSLITRWSILDILCS